MKTIVIIILAILVCTTSACAGGVGDAVEVLIVTDDGRTLPTYPVKMRPGLRKVYAEAIKGDHYRIEVKNRLNRRVGLVIAVDGRNIISGKKSWLKNSERMYILEPYSSGEFAGWRTAQDRINRFFFTDVPDSYAAAFGDESALGVIAVALYPEVQRYEPPIPLSRTAPSSPPRGYEGRAADSADKAEAAPAAREDSGKLMKGKDARSEQALESAGTGYGRGEYSPSQPRLVAPPFEKGAKEEKRAADSRAPIREETLAAARPAAPVRAAQEQDTLPAGEGALDKTLDRAGQQDAAKVPGTFSPDRKRQEKMADAGAVAGESGKTRAEPLPPLMTAAATSKRSVIELTLQVSDLAVAIREIEAHLDQVKARVIERQHHRESEFLKAEIAAPDAAALLDLLKALGRVNLETSPPTVTDGKVTVGIKIVSDR